MSEELKPCPFCGCAADWSVQIGDYFGECSECGARGPVPYGGAAKAMKEEAIRLWNTRKDAP